jgi:hypothetical protein
MYVAFFAIDNANMRPLPDAVTTVAMTSLGRKSWAADLLV